MATNCEDVSTRMMELLYGELPADERARIEAHVAGCARCRSEQEGFEKTRTAARQALDEAPPARVRAAIVKAAAEHLATQAQPAARKPAAPDKISFWNRIRAAWAFPTLATVGALAVAVFLVSNRAFQNPEQALQRPVPVSAPATPALEPGPRAAEPAPAQQPLDETAQRGGRFEEHDKQTIAPTSGGARDQKRVATGERANDYRDLAKDAVGGVARHGTPKGEAPGLKRPAAPMPELASGKPARKSAPAADAEKSFGDRHRAETQFAPPPPPREAPPPVKAGKSADKVSTKEGFEDDRLQAGESGSAGPRPTTAKPQAAGGNVAGALGGPGSKNDGYGSGVGQAAPAPAPRNEPAARRDAPAPAAAPAPISAPAAPPPAPAMKARAKSSADYDAEEMEAPAANAKKKEKKPASGRAAAVESLAQRADRLYAEGRWAEAVEAYRELLRQDPRNDDAARWRRLLVAAENNDVSDRNASVAEKRAAEAKASRKAAPAKAQRSDKAAASSAPAADQ